MPWKLRQYECEDCGALTRRNRKSNDPRICVPCGIDRQLNSARPMKLPEYPAEPPESYTR